jgi:hypothetical protein
MDYTPISAGRVLAAFALTVIVGVMPVLAIVLKDNSSTLGPLGVIEGYGGLVLGLGSIALAMALIGLTWLAVAFGRRVVRRPSRA